MLFHVLLANFISVLSNTPWFGGGGGQFIYSPTEGHLGYFQVLSAMNKTSIGFLYIQNIFFFSSFKLKHKISQPTSKMHLKQTEETSPLVCFMFSPSLC